MCGGESAPDFDDVEFFMKPTRSEWMAEGAGDLAPDLFRQIVDNTAYAFVVVDMTGLIRYAGASVIHALGWEAEELVGRNILGLLDERDAALAIEVLGEVSLVEGTGSGVPMVFRIQRPDGTSIPCEIGSSVLRDDDEVLLPIRFRPWAAQSLLDEFIENVGTGAPTNEVLSSLAKALVPSLEASLVVIHHGFDGTRFSGASASLVAPGVLTTGQVGPWVDTAIDGVGRVLSVEDLEPAVAAAARSVGATGLWTIRVTQSDAPPAVLSIWRPMVIEPLGGHRQVIDRAIRYLQLAQARASTEQRLRFLADHDALTGLSNRTHVRQEIVHRLSVGAAGLAVAFCDLDAFKPINDSFGHGVGDAVLVAVAGRLRGAVKVDDMVAREGGDEFVLLLHDVPDDDAAMRVGQRLAEAFRSPFVIEGLSLSITISIGVARQGPGISADALIQRSDAAVYAVKANGGDGCVVWSEDL